MRKSFFSLIKRFAREERGASLVEYAVLVGLITVAVVGVITTLGTQINTAFQTVVTNLTP